MISLIWLVFFAFNILILLVILMNFLIAIVSETYSLVMQNQISNIYFARATLNKEYFEIWAEKGYAKQEDFSHILFMTETVDQVGNNAGAPELVKNMKKDLNSVQNTFQDNKNKLAQQIHQLNKFVSDEIMAVN
jgi:hypothetical protein